MPPPELTMGALLVLALVAYFLLGGADFGGGVWDLLASGPRKREQQAVIEHAIGPVWEANHVWLILVVVLLFGAFPPAFAAISVALHVPLTLFLMGIVFRGSAFVFRNYDSGDVRQHRWGLVFSLASIIAPLMLGICVGAIASGRLRMEGGVVVGGFFQPWLAPFPLATGLFSLSLCAFLAAVYLTYESREPALQEDFRRRALAMGVGVAILAAISLLLSIQGAPLIFRGLTSRPWTWPLHALTAVAAVTALVALWVRRFLLARIAAAAQVTFILLGWSLSQFPYLVVPDLTLQTASAEPRTLRLLLLALALGAPILVPSLFVLFSVFKRTRRRPRSARSS